MPIFKTTYNILVKPWEDESFDPNWMDSDKIKLPPKTDWDYSAELKVENVSLWEQIYSQGGGLGLYAAWDPYAEFYLITLPGYINKENSIETYYGSGALEAVKKRSKELGIILPKNDVWIDPDNMWLFTQNDLSKKNPPIFI